VGNKLYVGNLAYSMTDASLQERFAEFGAVQSAKVMMDRDSGRSKGFGFVEMDTSEAAQAAIRGLNGKMIEGRDMVVNEARPKESNGFGGGQRRDNGGGGDRSGYRR
jgi:RNA recognition motif-containing protein